MLLSAPGFIPSQNGRIHVRGSHGQIQYVVDGVPMTDEYSEAFANPLDPRYVKSAEVMTGGIPAEYGGKLAAVVDITSKSGLDEPRKAFGDASLNVGTFRRGRRRRHGRRPHLLAGRLLPERRRQPHRSVSRSADHRQLPQQRPRAIGSPASSSCGRPTPTSSARSSRSTAADFEAPNRPAAQLAGVDITQDLKDNSQTMTWLHQLGTSATLDASPTAAPRPRRSTRSNAHAARRRPRIASLDHQGANASRQRDERHAPVQGGRPVRPQPDRRALPDDRQRPPTIRRRSASTRGVGGTPFAFDGQATGQNVGLFVQDTFSPVDRSAHQRRRALRPLPAADRGTAVSPRLGVAYHVHGTGTVLRGSYSRIFMPPFSENLLLSSSDRGPRAVADPDAAARTSGRSASTPTKSACSRRSATARSSTSPTTARTSATSPMSISSSIRR